MQSRQDHLQALLTSFTPSDGAEQRHRQAMLEHVGRSPDPFARTTFSPGHFTASSFVLGPSGDLLLIYHAKLQRWLQPGGHVDPEDRDLLEAAYREVAEEVGLTDVSLHPQVPGIFDLDIHEIPQRGSEPEHQHLDVRFLLTTPSAAVSAGSDALDARWVNPRQIDALETDPSVLRAVAKVVDLCY